MKFLLLAMSGSAIVDIVALALILGFAIYGATKGLINTLIKTFGTIIAVVLAVLFCGKFAVFLEDKVGIITFFSEKVSGITEKIFGAEVVNMTLAEVESAEHLLSSSGNKLSLFIINIILKIKGEGVSESLTVNEVLAPTFAYYISIVITGVALFILFKIALFFIGRLITKLHRFKPLGALDKILGLLFGIIEGVVWIQIAASIVAVIPLGFIQTLNEYIVGSTLVNLINKFNILGLLLGAFNGTKVVEVVKSILPTT